MKPSPSTNLIRKIRAHPTWKGDISPWLRGLPNPLGRFPDLPRRDRRRHRFYTSPVSVRFVGPFAEVRAIQDVARPGVWVANVLRCANPVAQDYTDLDELAKDFCGSVLHYAIRGVIG